MSKDSFLIDIDDIDDGDSAGVIGDVNGLPTSLIAVRKGLMVYLYLNTCPHIGAPLDFEPGRFLNLERDLIQCSLHGALFVIETGACVEGPCIGKHLTPVASVVRDGKVFLS